MSLNFRITGLEELQRDLKEAARAALASSFCSMPVYHSLPFHALSACWCPSRLGPAGSAYLARPPSVKSSGLQWDSLFVRFLIRNTVLKAPFLRLASTPIQRFLFGLPWSLIGC